MSCIKMCEQKGAGYWNNPTGSQPFIFLPHTASWKKQPLQPSLNLYLDEEKNATIANAVQCYFCEVTLIVMNSGSQMSKVSTIFTSDVFVCFFSCPEQLNRTHCPSLALFDTTNNLRSFTTLQNGPRGL